MVKYGETQEYLESLANEGYFLGYSKDNPPEEGKLTISKPNPEPDPITITAVNENEAKTADTTTDPNNYLDGPACPNVSINPDNLEWKEAKTTDITIDPGSLDGPNPIGGGHHRYHIVSKPSCQRTAGLRYIGNGSGRRTDGFASANRRSPSSAGTLPPR